MPGQAQGTPPNRLQDGRTWGAAVGLGWVGAWASHQPHVRACPLHPPGGAVPPAHPTPMGSLAQAPTQPSFVLNLTFPIPLRCSPSHLPAVGPE